MTVVISDIKVLIVLNIFINYLIINRFTIKFIWILMGGKKGGIFGFIHYSPLITVLIRCFWCERWVELF